MVPIDSDKANEAIRDYRSSQQESLFSCTYALKEREWVGIARQIRSSSWSVFDFLAAGLSNCLEDMDHDFDERRSNLSFEPIADIDLLSCLLSSLKGTGLEIANLECIAQSTLSANTTMYFGRDELGYVVAVHELNVDLV